MAAVASGDEGEAFQVSFAIDVKVEFTIRQSSMRCPHYIRDAYTPTSSEYDYQGSALTSSYLLLRHKAAKNATRGVFQWVTEIDSEDNPLIEDEIYGHEWMDVGGDAFKAILVERETELRNSRFEIPDTNI